MLRGGVIIRVMTSVLLIGNSIISYNYFRMDGFLEGYGIRLLAGQKTRDKFVNNKLKINRFPLKKRLGVKEILGVARKLCLNFLLHTDHLSLYCIFEMKICIMYYFHNFAMIIVEMRK